MRIWCDMSAKESARYSLSLHELLLLLAQTDRHLVDLAVENTQLALRIIIKINRAVAVQNMIDIGGKGGRFFDTSCKC